MRRNHVFGDRQPEPDAAGLFVARILQPVKRLKDIVAFVFRNSRTIVFNRQIKFLVVAFQLNRNRLAVAKSVGNNVGNRPFQSLLAPLDRTDLIIGRITNQRLFCCGTC